MKSWCKLLDVDVGEVALEGATEYNENSCCLVVLVYILLVFFLLKSWFLSFLCDAVEKRCVSASGLGPFCLNNWSVWKEN